MKTPHRLARWFITPAVLLVSRALLPAAIDQQPTSEQVQFFENKIRPILAEHCLECHSAEREKIKGGLNLDSKADWSKGGENGPIIKEGDVKGSTLIKVVMWEDDPQMPPKKKLSTEQIEDLKKWVQMGAPDPRTASAKAAKMDKKAHWAYQPVARPALPEVKNAAWCNNSIDRFVLQKLEEKGMMPSLPASKEALLRRAYFDLIGLPPTPKQIEDFLRDTRPEAFSLIIDRLLEDPGYGERWGRHWLDTARYSDTTGAEGNQRGADYRYAYAWSYREWVFNAINTDMPYDQFVLNQIAADKIPNNRKENLAALGFLTVGQRFPSKDDIINDRIDVVGRGFLGLTLACARCHDHKFDPVTAADYYALRGIFDSCTEPSEGPVIAGDPNSPAYLDFLKKLETLEKQAFDGYYDFIRQTGDKTRKNAAVLFEGLWMLQGPNTTDEDKKASTEFFTKNGSNEREARETLGRHFRANDRFVGPFLRLAPTPEKENRDKLIKLMLEGKSREKYSPHALEFLKAQKTLPQDRKQIAALFAQFMAQFEPQIPGLFAQIKDKNKDAKDLPDKDLLELATFPLPLTLGKDLDVDAMRRDIERFGQRLGGALAGRTNLQKMNELKLTFRGGPVRAMTLEDLPKPKDSPLYPRGNAPKKDDPVKIVPRRFIEVLSENRDPKPFSSNDSGRYELAKAIATKSNPLTARVMVNRVWMYHFGEGLVRTPDDLGNQAGTPSHPELLDFLSSWFMEDFGQQKPAWSVKALHKAIMLSKTYQQSSNTVFKGTATDGYNKTDPANNLLWRSNVRRLDFESFRDSLLSMAGILDRTTLGGPSFNVTEEPIITRRAAYAYVDRAAMPDLLMQFDMANPDQPNTKRTSTVVPQQALFLMNSPFAGLVVQNIVKRPEVVQAVAVERDTQKGITAIFRIVFQRSPTPEERNMALSFLLNENSKQKETKAASEQITKEAAAMAAQKLRGAKNSNNARKAIVNEGELTQRVAFSPWETLVQALIFANEAAYIN
jgi:mono/diheme cytochrome c family protein